MKINLSPIKHLCPPKASKSTLTCDRRTSLISEDECREPYNGYIQILDCHEKELVI